jgi:hypothetical protein
MSILHRRRKIKDRWKQREASGERCSAPHEYARASERVHDAGEPATAVPDPARPRRKRKVKAKRKAKPAAAVA